MDTDTKSEGANRRLNDLVARIKLRVDENWLSTLRLLETTGQIDKTLAAKQAAEYQSDIKKYTARSAETMAKAKSLEAE